MARTRKDKDKAEPLQAGDIAVPQGARQSDTEHVSRMLNLLTKYQQGKATNDKKIVDNDRWYKSQHWEVLRENANKKPNASEPEPVSAYLWNTIANRHGDLMDAYPEPVMVEREESDKDEAERLSKIVKVVLERNQFRKQYSDAAWSKCKSGTSAYHVSWDYELEGGIGDISVKKADLLRLYWEPSVDDIQDSPYLFALSMVDTDELKQKYPILAEKNIEGTAGLKMERYGDESTMMDDQKTMVVDCYSKQKLGQGRTVLHLDKIVGSIIVESTRFGERADRGLYDHGKYPFVVDVLFPMEHSVIGMGLVDLVKSPQMYLDKLDQIITKNALVSGRQRILYKDGLFPAEDIADVSKEFVACQGNLREGEDYAVLQGKPLGSDIMTHRQNKIAELKEISGTNDFNRGSSGGGITAASAIMALQEAGNKLSRAMIAMTYDAYSEICNQVIELITQFYDEPRKFRITNEQGDAEYVEYSNEGLIEQPMEAIVEGMAPETRRPIFDISVKAEKKNPFSSVALNELAKELFSAGFFSPELAPAALIALELMSFDGKDTIQQRIQEQYENMMAMQQAQVQAQQEIAQNNEIMMQMNEIIKQTTGQDMLAGSTMAGNQQQQQMQ